MPIKSKRELVCHRCGKIFNVACGDNITVIDLKRLSSRLCLKCKIISKLKIGTRRYGEFKKSNYGYWIG